MIIKNNSFIFKDISSPESNGYGSKKGGLMSGGGIGAQSCDLEKLKSEVGGLHPHHMSATAHNPFLYNANAHNGNGGGNGMVDSGYGKLSSDMYSDYSRLFSAAGTAGSAAGDYSKLLAGANDYSKLFGGAASAAATADYSKLLNSAAAGYNPFMQNPYMNPSAAAQLGMAAGGGVNGPHGGHQSAHIPGIVPTSY